MKNKKGFTLVEMLVVLGIICVLALIITPAIISYRNKANNEYNDKLKDNIITVAKDYYTNNRSELPNGQIEGKYIDILTLDKMKQNNLFSNDVIDAYKNNCSSESYVVVENNRGNYDYYLCLKCGDKTYETDKSYCDFKEGIGVAPTCSLTYNDGWSKKNVLITVTSTDSAGVINIKNNGKALKTTYDDITKIYTATYEVTNSGIYNFEVLNKYGLKTTCKTENSIKIDKDSPRCVISKQDKTNLSMNLFVTATDDTSPIKTVKIGDSVLDSTNLYNVTKNGKYIAKVIDSAGNENTCSVDVTELDSEKPKITVTGNSSSSLTVTITDNVGVVGYKITTSPTTPTEKEWTKVDSVASISQTFNNLSSSTTYYIHAIDEAGNTSYEKATTKSATIIIYNPDPDPTPSKPTNPQTGGGNTGGTSNPQTGASGSSGGKNKGGAGCTGIGVNHCPGLQIN